MPDLVTCLCLTRNRREWLSKAIDYFMRQTYPNRELLIVADGEGVWDLMPADVRVRLISARDGLTIGEKRNYGCLGANGAIVAHWDDDDYSAPGRVAAQVARIHESGKCLTGYHSMKFTDGEKWWLYRGFAGMALGTSLCYRREFWDTHRFDNISSGEDSAFVAMASREQRLAAENDMDLMYATIHPGNTSPRVCSGGAWSELPGFEWKEAA